MKKMGIIVIEDAWPVTDALCLSLADGLKAQVPVERVRITYARMHADSWVLSDEIGTRNVEYRALAGLNDLARTRQPLEEAVSGVPEDLCSILILQEKSFILRFYDMLSEQPFQQPFQEQLRNEFGIVASDYALGTAMNGIDVLRRVGSGFRRLLISAQAEETLPGDWSSVCDERIDKSAIRIATLARRLLDARAQPKAVSIERVAHG
jgi:hypothetical protein